MKTTPYFEEQGLHKRPYLKREWCQRALDDPAYYEAQPDVSVDSKEVVTGVVLDFDEEGHLVGIDLDHASNYVNLSRLEATSLPLANLVLA